MHEPIEMLNNFYPKNHKWCGCPNCGECECIVCKESEKMKLASQGEWIEIKKHLPGFKDRLPFAYQKILFFAEERIHYGYFTDNAYQQWHSIGEFRNFENEVTHWMRLPEEPK